VLNSLLSGLKSEKDENVLSRNKKLEIELG